MDSEYLTIDEIENRYPNEWVVLARPKFDRYQRVTGGYVIHHAVDRDELDRQMEERGFTDGAAILHTSHRAWAVVPHGGVWSALSSLALIVGAFGLMGGIAWLVHTATVHATVPDGVRTFGRIGDELEAHAAAVRAGQIPPETDANGIVRYPLTAELRNGGVEVCVERDGALWYVLPSDALDGGMPYLVTPRDPAQPVTALPGQLGGRTYHFQPLRGNWAYWFRG